MANLPLPTSSAAPAHKGTDKWFALGDELASQPPSADQRTTHEHATISRTLRLRKALVVGLAMLPVAVVAVALSVATLRRHLDHALPPLAIAAAAPAPASVPAAAKLEPAAQPIATAPAPAAAAAPAATPTPAASGAHSRAKHSSRAHRTRVKPSKHASTR